MKDLNPSGIKVKLKSEVIKNEPSTLKVILICFAGILLTLILQFIIGLIITGFKGVTFI